MKKYNDIEQSKKIAEYLTSIMQNKETEQSEEFNQWVKENSSAMDILTGLSNEEELTYKYNHFIVKDKELSAKKMLKKMQAQQHKRVFAKISSIAAALIAISFAVWYSYHNNDIKQEISMTQIEDKVKFVLENGDIVELNDDIDSIKTKDMLLHNAKGENIAIIDNQTNTNDQILITKLIVPKKKNYSIVLSDGTKVMLNANSELSFPNRFNGATREVTIKGEGYFEVTKNSKTPFIVHSDGIAIKVYGTKFNVNNYDSQQFETTLLEGSIGVTVNNKEQILKPNQLITINNKSGYSRIDDVKDTNKYIAWTNDYFVFQADNLAKVINELSRWYNVEFTIGNSSKLNIPITGSFKRNTELDEIIKSLEIISGIKLIKNNENMIE